MNRKRTILRQVVLASLLTAMITALTYYIKIPAYNGYLHIGDSIIYLAACLLPTPLALFCGALGGAFADVLGGYTLYALPSFIIKALLTLPFSGKSQKILTRRSTIASVIGIPITAVGYYIAEAVIITISSSNGADKFKSVLFSPIPWTASLYTIPANLIQAAVSAAVFIILASALDKTKLKQKLK